MANRTVKEARTVHGTNPQYILEKIIRTRIYESRFWKEDCFALNAELIVDKGMELRYIGGIYGGNIKPTPFLCLTLKLLQIQPDKDIVIEFIRQEDFKYIRALGAFYLRLTGESLEVFKYLEPLYNDFRKLRRMDRMGQFDVIHMDEFIDMLLREERVFDVILPRIQKREIHEESGELEQRTSVLDEDLDADMESDEEETQEMNEKTVSREDKSHRRSSPPRRHRSRSRSRSRSPSRRERRSRSPHGRSSRRSRSRERDRETSRRERSRSRDRRDRERERKRSRSPKREKGKKPKKEKKEKSSVDTGETDKEKAEKLAIAEANAIRAKLGLKPLKP